jgi:CRISPR-associated endonuclease/helicase Cas3
MSTPLAHVGDNGEEHALLDHLRAVAHHASQTSAKWRSAHWGYMAGLWHDLGKYRPGFQQYIRKVSDAHIEGKLPRNSDKTHSAAGALHALKTFERRFGETGGRVARVLAYVIAGHHAGLADWDASLDARLLGAGGPGSECEYLEALDASAPHADEIHDLPTGFDFESACRQIPGIGGGNPLAVATWIRMLFSALVDADFLDTEAFMDPRRAARRASYRPLTAYRDQLASHLAALRIAVQRDGRGEHPVMRARANVLEQCIDKARLPPGIFTLAVPTGGGKTLSSLAFALEHAVANRKRRVVYAIPYTSIIEQTADVFAGIFGPDAVVEHHSQAESDERDETPSSRLACENWDAPLIVTTNVQLFESLFAARTSRCRKLHNIAHSVLVLDEAQLLPATLLQPTLDVLNLLVAHYGVTLVLCTATQPTLVDTSRFDPRRSLRGLARPTPIIDDETALYGELERVRVEWPDDLQTPIDTNSLAGSIADHDCVLTIVNSRRDASEIVHALDAATGDTTLHLSAAMCGQHRADVIAAIRARLAARRNKDDDTPVRVVSTQLVEAGVDIDFPVVFRALAGLDSIAQAAGRCNREGMLPNDTKGRVVVFVREIPRPLAALVAGANATRSALASGADNPLAPHAYDRYFSLYYSAFPSLDEHGIVDLLRTKPEMNFGFRSAADRFRFIDDADSVSVIVPYRSTRPDATDPTPLVSRLRRGDTDRWLLRGLQRYIVNIRRSDADAWLRRGELALLVPGLYLLIDELRYDDRFGLLLEGASPDAARFVI